MSEPQWTKADRAAMRRALELAPRGQGSVEPNPMVGCVIVKDGQTVAEGWHQRYGGPHAEVEALRAAGDRSLGATMYVSLEPCCHAGATPPCTLAIINSGVRRVVAAFRDPFPMVDGAGVQQLQAANIDVQVGLLEDEARRLNAPFIKLVEQDCPWVIAKWAMTLDGKIATRTGASRWISGESSRRFVHQVRGRVDAVLIGKNTAIKDDPLLTARPPGPRIATRIVLDTHASLPVDHQLVKTADPVNSPTMVVVGRDAPDERSAALSAAGCEVFMCLGQTRDERLDELFTELAGRQWTNVLAEGGGRLLGSLLDRQLIDEAHIFLANKILGGAEAVTPVGGMGVELVDRAISLDHLRVDADGDDLHISGYLAKP